jgi:hypothetical protein
LRRADNGGRLLRVAPVTLYRESGKENEMNKKVREMLEKRIRQFVFDDVEEHPFYVGELTIKHLTDATVAVYDAMKEAANLEVENQPEANR